MSGFKIRATAAERMWCLDACIIKGSLFFGKIFPNSKALVNQKTPSPGTPFRAPSRGEVYPPLAAPKAIRGCGLPQLIYCVCLRGNFL